MAAVWSVRARACVVMARGRFTRISSGLTRIVKEFVVFLISCSQIPSETSPKTITLLLCLASYEQQFFEERLSVKKPEAILGHD